VAIAGGIAALAGVNFLVILLGAGIFYLLVRRGQVLPAFALVGLAILGVWMFSTMAPQVLPGGAPVPARQPGCHTTGHAGPQPAVPLRHGHSARSEE
jgi:hypothetical protein